MLCAVLFAAGVRYGGKQLVLWLNIPPEATGIEVTFSDENVMEAAASAEKIEEGRIPVRFTPLNPGKTVTTVTWPGVEEDGLYAASMEMEMRTLASGIIFDSLTYDFTGWEYLMPCFGLFCLLTAVCFFAAFLEERKETAFTYRVPRHLGFGLFFLILGLMRIGDAAALFNGGYSGTMWSQLIGIAVSGQSFLQYTGRVMFVCAALVALSNVQLIRREGMRPANMYGLMAAALIAGGAAFGLWLPGSGVIFGLRNAVCNVFAGVYSYFECLLAATVICAVLAGRHEPAYDKSHVIILGCCIRPDGTLYPLVRARADRAIRFAEAQQKATGMRPCLVASGGKAGKEPVAEGEAIAAYLREQGVPQEKILVEGRSTTTMENMKMSLAVINEHMAAEATTAAAATEETTEATTAAAATEKTTEAETAAENAEKATAKKMTEAAKADRQPRNIAFATSDYHVFRGGILAGQAGIRADGMGAHTKWYFWPNAFIREFIGLLAESFAEQAVIIVIFIAVSLLLTFLM